ncbi:MAG TPA: hypothetical protein VKV05_14885 [Terriglobales bacterium]|nr:hypothetical protein [Terriglobales bacterium]
MSFLAGAGASTAIGQWSRGELSAALHAVLYTLFLILCFAIYFTLRLRREDRSAERQGASTQEVMRPDPEAEMLARSSHEAHVVVGRVIEIFASPNLGGQGALDEKGWKPSDVVFGRTDGKRDFSPILTEIGGIDRHLPLPNRKKFGIAGFSAVTFDSDEQPEIRFYETDWHTYKSVYQVLNESSPRSSQLRKKFSSLDPAANRVPNSMSLQSVVLFPSHEILCMSRREGLDTGGWSISFEEQLKDLDFDQMPDVSPAEFLFRRAFVEEVLGCRSENVVDIRKAWQDLEQKNLLRSYRLWALFYEVPVAHFQLLGFYWLNATPAELASYHLDAKSKGWAGVDPEGKLFVLKVQEWDRLLGSGYGRVSGLYDGSKQDIVRLEYLHRTSLYRLWRIANLLGYTAPSSSDHHLTLLNLAAHS